MSTLVLTVFVLMCLSVFVRLMVFAVLDFPVNTKITAVSQVFKITLHGGLAVWCAWALWA